MMVLAALLAIASPQIKADRKTTARLLLILVGIQILLFVIDALRVFSGSVDDYKDAFHITQLAFPLMQVVLMGALIIRFINTLAEAEALNRDLASKVEATRLDIEMNFNRKREIELQQAAEMERSRIYRELHDDLGSKLLSIAHGGRDSRLGDLAAATLQSLRESVSRAIFSGSMRLE